MEEAWVVERAKLRDLLKVHPQWSIRQLCEATGHSDFWVKKWKKRLRASPDEDTAVLHGLPRRRKHPPAKLDERIVKAILDIRDNPPPELGRTAGARYIRYRLEQNAELQAAGLRLASLSSIWKVLNGAGRIVHRYKGEHHDAERPGANEEWELDFADVITVVPDPEGKRQHSVEMLNVVDRGTSILIASVPAADYNQETALIMTTDIMLEQGGRPGGLRIDRDPRLVGSWTIDGFPSAFVRYCLCLEVEVSVCKPRRPDLKPFVERFNRTVQHECILVQQPKTLDATKQVLAKYGHFYNYERPHQGAACQNQPPRVAFPTLPALRPLPTMIDADGWLKAFHNKYFKRRVSASGTVSVDTDRYYIGQRYAGHYVNLRVDAVEKQLYVELDGKEIKHMPIKCLLGGEMPFDEYFDLICQQARSEDRRLQLAKAYARAKAA